ncbi:hypothetical protein LCL87_15365 [Rhodococcus hoagii]|nr:hypothetical protein [Prescottella equi]
MNRGLRRAQWLAVAAVATVAVAGCATEVTETRIAKSGSSAATTATAPIRKSDTVATDLTTWAAEFCTAYTSLLETLTILDRDDSFDAKTVARVQHSFDASLPALDTLIDMPAPPVADAAEIKPILDASHRVWKTIIAKIAVVLDANPKGLDAAGVQEMEEVVKRTEPALSPEERAEFKEFGRRIGDLHVPECTAAFGTP